MTERKARPRLLHITTTDISLRFLLLGQLQMFKLAGFDVTAMSAPGPWRQDLADAGIPFIPWPSATRRWDPKADARALKELIATLRRERFDIVHTHNPKPGVLGRIAGRATGVPAVVNTVHGLYATEGDRSPMSRAFLGAEWLASKFSHVELYQSAEDLRRARRIGIASPKRSHHLGNGIDISRFSAARIDTARADALRKEWEIPEGAPVVGMVGRLVNEKGWPEYFAAARIVRERTPEAVFLAIGPSDEDKADAVPVEQIASASSDVRFPGMTMDMPEALSLLDVFALASHREGFPRSAIEAASMGKPLVLTDIRGCREVVTDGDNGLLVPLQDPPALAAGIERLLGDERLRAQMGAASRARAEEDFDERRVVRRTLAVYDRLLARRKGAKA